MTVTKKLIGRLPILIGEYDSTKVYNKKQRVTLYGSEFESKVDNNTTAPATLSNGTLTINTDNWRVVSNGTEAFLAGEKIKHFNEEDNPEFVSVNTDNDGKLLESTDVEGKKTIYGNLEIKGKLTNNYLIEQIEDKVDKDEGKSFINKDVASQLSVEENPEFTAINIDGNGKLIDTIDKDGVETHNTEHIFNAGIKDSTGNLQKNVFQYVIDNSSDLAKALKEGNYALSATDWSDYISNDGDNPLHLPEPRCAILNLITNIDLTNLSKVGLVSKTEEGKRYNVPVTIQFWDKAGNYFSKNALISGQGSSSISQYKKNINIDFFDKNVNGDTFAIKFGNWVSQDSYHLKAYYTDFIRGSGVVAYKIADLIEKDTNPIQDRPWKRALIDASKVSGDSYTNIDLQLDNGALCHPDGFPVIIYQNGNFYGIFSWQLKKHRDNYHLIKDKAEHVYLDGILTNSTIFDGNISWNQFEIRNPKNLYYKEAHSGTFEYNADIAQAEIAGDDEVNAWINAGQLPDGTKITSKIQKKLQITAKVKNYIIALSKYRSEILAANTDEDKKTLWEKYFDVHGLIDYGLVQKLTDDNDSFGKNWQWFTYDGIKWYVGEYDKDQSFGNDFIGMLKSRPLGNITDFHIGRSIYEDFNSLYQTETKARAKELVDDGVVNEKNFISILYDWINRIGADNYKKEYEKWYESPCCRDDGIDKENWSYTRYIYFSSKNRYSIINKGDIVTPNDTSFVNVYKSLVDNNTADFTDTTSWENVTYDNSKTYNKGDTCWLALYGRAFQFTAIKNTSANPFKKSYEHYPTNMGQYDNIWRFIKSIQNRVSSFIKVANS